MKKKLNKTNLLALIILACCGFVIISDFAILFINIATASWTAVGMLTFWIAVILGSMAYDHLENEITKKEK